MTLPLPERLVIRTSADCTSRSAPFPHLIATPCLSAQAYEELDRLFPAPTLFDAQALTLDNRVLRISSSRVLQEPDFAPCWRQFVADHTSPQFWMRIVERFGAQMRDIHPHLEARVGRSMDQWKVVRRGSREVGDVTLECQLVINTPVQRVASSVKAPHVDQVTKLWTGLLYLREATDPTVGGDLELYAARDKLRFDKHQAPRSQVTQVATHRYAPNSFIGFVNSARAIHAVADRQPTPQIRRYVDFVVEFAQPVFDLPRMGPLQRRWFRFRHRQDSR